MLCAYFRSETYSSMFSYLQYDYSNDTLFQYMTKFM